MAGDSVGQIGLDLVVNKNGFDKQMSGIQGVAKKAGLALAAAFAVKKLFDFSAECIQLGSDLQEVQNVVDVTFPQMSKQVNAFAQDAAASFGLSETMAKKFTGTFGAMAKAFGFNEKAAYDMSTSLTGLSGDVASFYNISQDEAFTKLKSVFTGETESLKDLGIVMTQTALDQYALANGFGKTTQAMSEGEKVALRYKFVTEQLSLASGDFLRTSDGWANQVRVLKLQFDSLKATIGAGLINVLTPVIKVINQIIGKLISLANAFKAFTEFITGKKGGDKQNQQAQEMGAIADAADKTSDAMGGVGGAAKKAAKDIKSVTMGIDELNIIEPPSESSGGGSGGEAGDGGYSSEDFDMGELDTAPLEEVDAWYQGIIDKAKELASILQAGFLVGLGDKGVFDSIKQSIADIGESLKEIVTDADVQSAADRFVTTFLYNLGKMVGSVVSIGASIADNLLAGLSIYLQGNKERIKEFLISMFDIGSKLSSIGGNWFEALATVFEAFRSDSAKQITADIIGIFANGFMGVVELGTTFAVDMLDAITAPFINNKDLIKQTLEDTFSAVEPIFSEIKSIVDETFAKLKDTYDTSVAPTIQSFEEGWTELATQMLESYNKDMLPVLEGMAGKFSEFRENSLSPMIDKFCEFTAILSESLMLLWETILKPLISWFVETFSPIISTIFENVVGTIMLFVTIVTEAIGMVLGVFSGILLMLQGDFKGGWEKIWTSVGDFLKNVWNAIKKEVNEQSEAIQKIIDSACAWIKEQWETFWNGVEEFTKGILTDIKEWFDSIITDIKEGIQNKLAAIKKGWEDTWNKIKEYVSGVLNNIKEGFETSVSEIKEGIQNKLADIKKGWEDTWNNLKESTKRILSDTWDGIKGIINKILSGVESMANGVVRAINKMIDALNSMSFDVPEWIPDIGGENFGLNIPKIPEVSIPKLAQGGFVKANTPQLAMIGDNRHYGEIVAPEDKMQEMVNKAVSMASGSGMSDVFLEVIVELLKKLIDLVEQMDLTVMIDVREIKKSLTDLEKRTGYHLRRT